jgi:hypothetical protein
MAEIIRIAAQAGATESWAAIDAKIDAYHRPLVAGLRTEPRGGIWRPLLVSQSPFDRPGVALFVSHCHKTKSQSWHP